MKIQWTLIAIVLSIAEASSLAQSDVGLAPWFGDNMVLQRGTNTLLEGYGPPGKSLTVRLRHGSATFFRASQTYRHVPVDTSGHWRITIDLTMTEFRESEDSWTLRLEDEKNRKDAREYQNIAIGDIIIIAGWEQQGLAADIDEFVSGTTAKLFEHSKDRLRFLTWTGDNFPNRTPAVEPQWQNWPENKSELKHYSTLELRLAYLLAESKVPDLATSRYIGIVRMERNALGKAIDPARFNQPSGFERLDDKLWNWISEDVRTAEFDRMQRLIQNKRRNIVADIPLVIDYDRACYGFWADFDPAKPPRDCFSFAGAIWSVSPATKQALRAANALDVQRFGR